MRDPATHRGISMTEEKKMQTVTISISGCDDNTAFTVTTDERGLQEIRQLQLSSHLASEYECQPVIAVYEGDILDDGGDINYGATRTLMWHEDLEGLDDE